MDKNLFVDKNALSVRSSRLSPSVLSTVNFPPCDWRHNILCVPNYLYTLGKRSSKGETASRSALHFTGIGKPVDK